MEKESKRKEKENLAEVGNGKPIKWDSGSSLYDSFELESFERKLHSAINSRTLSMPHLSDHRRLPEAPPPMLYQYQTQPYSDSHDHKSQSKKLSSKISRSIFHKFLCFVHKPKHQNNSSGSLVRRYEYEYDSSNSDSVGLSSILEAPEIDSFSPKFGSQVVRRTTSERFQG